MRRRGTGRCARAERGCRRWGCQLRCLREEESPRCRPSRQGLPGLLVALRRPLIVDAGFVSHRDAATLRCLVGRMAAAGRGASSGSEEPSGERGEDAGMTAGSVSVMAWEDSAAGGGGACLAAAGGADPAAATSTERQSCTGGWADGGGLWWCAEEEEEWRAGGRGRWGER